MAKQNSGKDRKGYRYPALTGLHREERQEQADKLADQRARIRPIEKFCWICGTLVKFHYEGDIGRSEIYRDEAGHLHSETVR